MEPERSYEVVKQHHRMSWLKQRRVLRVSLEEVIICLPRASPTAAWVVRRSFPLAAVERVALTSRTSFALGVKGAHEYTFLAPNALDITVDIRQREAIARALRLLSGEDGGGGDAQGVERRRKALIESFLSGRLAVPRSCEGPADDAVGQRMLKGRVEIMMAVRKGERPGVSQRVDGIVQCLRQTPTGQVNLYELREEMTALKSMLLDDSRKAPGETDEDIFMQRIAEDVIQQLVIIPTRNTLWGALHFDSAAVGDENNFQVNCERLRGTSVEEFGIPLHFSKLNFDIVLEHLKSLPSQATPSGMLDSIVLAIKSILLTIQANAITQHFDEESNGSKSLASSVEQFGASLPTGGLAIDDISTPLEELGAKNDAATAVLTTADAVAAGSVTDIDSEGNKIPEASSHARSNNNQCSSGIHEEVHRSSVNHASSEKSDKQDTNKYPGRSRRAKSHADIPAHRSTVLSADDVLPLVIFLLCYCKVNELVLVRQWINILGDPTECSERTYFFTVFASAIEFISSSGASNPSSPLAPSTETIFVSPYSSQHSRMTRAYTSPQ